MPLMPAREPRPEPLARARARLEFDELSHRRVVKLADAGRLDDAETLRTLTRTFADEVDRENSTRGILRAGVSVDYVDAVALTGTKGTLVVDAIEYDGAPLYCHARAGVIEDGTVVRGRDLDGYLRTGEQRYAEAIGLGS